MSVNSYIGQATKAAGAGKSRRGQFRDIELGILQMQVLWLLGHSPSHGYQLIKKLDEIKQTKVTAGVLYPVLARLVKLGLIKSEEIGRRKVYSVTHAGRQILTRTAAEFCKTFEGIFRDYTCMVCVGNALRARGEDG